MASAPLEAIGCMDRRAMIGRTHAKAY